MGFEEATNTATLSVDGDANSSNWFGSSNNADRNGKVSAKVVLDKAKNMTHRLNDSNPNGLTFNKAKALTINGGATPTSVLLNEFNKNADTNNFETTLEIERRL